MRDTILSVCAQAASKWERIILLEICKGNIGGSDCIFVKIKKKDGTFF